MKAFHSLLILFSVCTIPLSQAFSQGQVTTCPPLAGGNGQGGITFNVSTNSAVVIDTIWCAFYGSTATVQVWYSQTAINGAPTINTTNGWVMAGSATITPVNTSSSNPTLQQIPIDLNIPMSGGDEFGFWVGNNNGAGVAYTTYSTANQSLFTDGTVSINTGPNVGYGGNAPNPTFTVRQFNGRVVYSSPIINEFPYCQNFENGDGDYASGGIANSWDFGTPSNTTISAAYSGDNAWVTNLSGDYNNDEVSYVQSPRMDLTALVSPAIKFNVQYALQSGIDGVNLEISQDSGYTWTTLGSSGSPSPWYNSSSITALGSLGNGNGWTGSSSGWTEMRHSLLPYANDTAFFVRWKLASNGTTVNEGFAFDDIVVAESNDVVLSDVIYGDSVCGTSFQTITAVLCNNSVVPKSGFSVDVDTNGTINTYSYSDTLDVCECDTVDVLTFNASNGGYWTFAVEVVNSGDVNASNDTLSGDILVYAIPGGSISAGTGPFCEGDAVELTFNFTGSGPWNCIYTNGVGNFNAGNVSSPYTAFATTSGYYEIVSLTDATGCAGDSGTFGGGVNIVINPNPDPDLGSDTTICGTYVIDAGPGSSYIWNTGASTQTLVITNPGTYAVTVIDANGCEGYDEVELDVNPLPVIGIEDTVLCDGGTFLFNAGGPFVSYLWDDGSTGQVRVVSSLTTVSVTVTDFNGCTNSKSASITEIVDNPNPNVKNEEGLAPVTLNAGGGYLSYYWNTGQQTQTISVYASGTYTCTVTDHNGCKGSDNGKASIWPASVNDIVNNEGVALFPNPVKDRFELRFASPDMVPTFVSLIDMSGRQVAVLHLESGVSNHQLTVPESLVAGNYVLRIQGQELSADLPLVIMD